MTSDDDSLAQWALLAAQPDAKRFLASHAADAYLQASPDSVLVEFDSGTATFLFDMLDVADGREPRTVAAWGRVPDTADPRDKSRHDRFPIAKALTDAGYDKGHLIARATGGGFDANIFAQAWQVNQGRSPERKRFRNLQRLAAHHPKR